MSNDAKPILTPIARLLWGDLYTPRDTDFEGKPRLIKNGPNAGKPDIRWEFGVGIQKTPGQHWATSEWGAIIWAMGYAAHPNSAARPDFAWKVGDGDSTAVNKKGNRNCDNPDYKGLWILSFSSSFAPKIVNHDGSAFILEPNAVVPGYFVQVAGNVVGNTGQTPGVYLNHNIVSFQGIGPRILVGPDPKTIGFGQGPRPPGMDAPPAGGMTAPPVAGQPPPPPAVPAPPAVATPPAPPPAPTAVAPHPGFIPAPPPGAAPPPPPPVAAAAPPPPPAGPQMTAKANGVSYAAYRASGWSDEQLRAGGLMV